MKKIRMFLLLALVLVSTPVVLASPYEWISNFTIVNSGIEGCDPAYYSGSNTWQVPLLGSSDVKCIYIYKTEVTTTASYPEYIANYMKNGASWPYVYQWQFISPYAHDLKIYKVVDGVFTLARKVRPYDIYQEPGTYTLRASTNFASCSPTWTPEPEPECGDTFDTTIEFIESLAS